MNERTLSDRRPYRHHHHHHHHQPVHQQELRRNFEDRCRTLEEELQRKSDLIDSLRYVNLNKNRAY